MKTIAMICSLMLLVGFLIGFGTAYLYFKPDYLHITVKDPDGKYIDSVSLINNIFFYHTGTNYLNLSVPKNNGKHKVIDKVLESN